MGALLGAEFAALGVAGLGSYIILSRRRIATKLEIFLGLKSEEELQMPPGLAQELHLPDGDRVALKESYLNNTDFKWLAVQPGIEDNAHPNKKHMLDITWYMMECYLRFVEKYGFLLVQRDPKTKKFQGAIGIIPPYKKYWRFKTQYQIAALTLGRQSVPEKLGISKRYKAYVKELHNQQEQIISNSISGDGHWYIPFVAVATPHKQTGVARQLVETTTRLCRPRPIYLQCPDDTTNFFEKVGFLRDNRFPLVAPGGNQNIDRGDVIYYNGMVCQ